MPNAFGYIDRGPFYGSPLVGRGGGPAGFNYTLPSGPGAIAPTLAVFTDRLEVTFAGPVALSGPAIPPSAWIITTGVGGAPIPTVTSIGVVGSVVTLYTTEARGGTAYTLNLPGIGIFVGSVPQPFIGPFTINYTALGVAPVVSLAGAQDSSHVKVIFSEPVVVAEALIPSNYVITGGAGLTVLGVVQETDRTFVLSTSLQTPGQSYTVSVSNIHDLYGNLI